MSFCSQSGVCNISDISSISFLRSLRSALSFHAVSFGLDAQAGSLRRMVQIATEIYDSAPRDPFASLDIPCSYREALDTVRDSNQWLNASSRPFSGSTSQYLFSDRRLATQTQSDSQAYRKPSPLSLIHDISFDVEVDCSFTRQFVGRRSNNLHSRDPH